jgi:ParB family chromosome partitioning protein
MATPTLAVAEQILHVPLANIRVSKHNPRKSFDPAKLAELAEDIKRRGVQEPILLRPIAGAEGTFEIVFGERRFRASEKAEQETLPAVVREISDDEAYELRIIENLQREDLHPLDEADAFYRLYKKAYKEKKSHDDSLTFIAAQVAKSPEKVAQRMKLRDLIDDAKDAFRKGKVLLGHAFQLARLREEEQKKTLQWMLSRGQEVQTAKGWKRVHLMPGIPELKLWIQQHIFLDLTSAPFDTADKTLNPKMGACTDCQFRTGNQPKLFGDVRQASTCTVPECWLGKRNASLVDLAGSIAKELGVKSVLKVGIGYSGINDSKVPVDVYVDYNSEARIVKKGSECKDTKPGVITWIGHQVDGGGMKVGDSVAVCTKAQDCAVHNKVDSHTRRPRKSFEQMADTRIANLRHDYPQKVRSALIHAVIESALKETRKLSPADKIKFELIADQMHRDLYFDRHRDLCKLMSVDPPKDKPGDAKDWRGASCAIFDGNPVAMMVAMALMHHYHLGFASGEREDPLKPLLRVYNVNAKAIAKISKDDVDGKIAAIEATLRKRKTRSHQRATT